MNTEHTEIERQRETERERERERGVRLTWDRPVLLEPGCRAPLAWLAAGCAGCAGCTGCTGSGGPAVGSAGGQRWSVAVTTEGG